ncbi:hypothetical protein JTE90_021898 [Oedothorax gibbosus]|uniref:HTH La-type RNA-binding domain-containing protein n=1 Tax=Oedothorax gibbosus TaxID=931172 RepID=A0AAV6VUR1_9ARAC|nr:hypothetical protein JTE90_021898 [Oedothorax gibbosus]
MGCEISHVSNIHPGSFCNQTTSQLCRTDQNLNLDSCDRNTKVQVVFPDMDNSTGIATSSSPDAASSNASSNPVPPETLTYQLSPNPIEMYPTNPEHMEEMAANERMDLPTLKTLLRRQLEYYFSSENLSTDEYLQSQMDADRFVAISTVAKFNQVRRLTDDYNLVVEVLRESAVVQVDEAGEKVRPSPRSRVLILREIPESTPMKEIEELFSGETCPKFLRCEFAHNNSWYVLFETDEDTAKAYQYLREEAKTFRGKPVMARLKAKAVTSAPYTTYKNGGATNIQEQDSYNGQNVNQQPQQAPLQYTYTNVPSDSYNNQQALPPFYPPTMLQAWAPTTPACVDLGTVLSVNGLSPQAAFRPLNNNTNRHNYTSRDRPVKAYTPQNYNFSRSEQSRYYNNRGQSTSYLQRQHLHQQAASFPDIVNTNNCGYNIGYIPYHTTSRSRNIHNFGVDMNFFTAPNLYYSKLPQQYPAARHNPQVVMPRGQVGLGAINCQDQSYLAVGNSQVTYTKDSSVAAVTGVKQNADSQVKENWAPNQRQQRGERGKRWWKENGSSSSSRNYSESANSSFKSVGENEVKPESPKFDLETTSFPPLPGCMVDPDVDVEVYESRLSDIVKGTVRPTTRDTKTQTAESALVCTATKDSSTITIEDTIVPSDGAFTPPASPENVVDAASAVEAATNVENCQEHSEWDDFVESPADSTHCSSSINPINVVPETFISVSSTQAFHPTNSVSNGSVPMAESSTSTPAILPEPIANVPSEVNENKQATAVKLPKAKQLDPLPKMSRACDLPSPKNKTPDASSAKNKFDSFKDRATTAPKHRTSFSNSKNNESSSSNKERSSDFVPANSKTLEHGSSKSSDGFYKEKVIQGYGKGKMAESGSNKSKALDVESALLSVNGHADSESTVSSEDEKQPFRKLTYSEVALRAKDKVEKIAQELKEKERQEAMVRQHRQQDNVAQSRWPVPRIPKGPSCGTPPRI